ncbi:MAG: hypothetical protein C4K49_02970 [Candidatus Thorarchaeota archaeon]|nr:MAG: hypothetical protein C4K49_02970 [Candidatus Thorarchaeota archaeon]
MSRKGKADRRKARLFPLEKEYARIITALDGTGILTLLPQSESLGVIGIDGKEYPVPTQEQVQEEFARNKELVDRKMRQGFTQLQLTPIAMPTPQLIDRVKAVVLEHAAAGRIIQTKQNRTDADTPVRVRTDEPIWIWTILRQTVDTPNLVYFPQVYTKRDHRGLTKEEVMQSIRLCAVPGWSVGLIEPIPIMPQQGQGKVKGGRKQLEAFSTPRDYLRTLSTPTYQGETGWTPEDFLTHFVTQLETTNQVSHDRYDNNAMWMLGTYMPDSVPYAELVPTGYWARPTARMYLSAHRTGNRFRLCVARSMVRLGAT